MGENLLSLTNAQSESSAQTPATPRESTVSPTRVQETPRVSRTEPPRYFIAPTPTQRAPIGTRCSSLNTYQGGEHVDHEDPDENCDAANSAQHTLKGDAIETTDTRDKTAGYRDP